MGSVHTKWAPLAGAQVHLLDPAVYTVQMTYSLSPFPEILTRHKAFLWSKWSYQTSASVICSFCHTKPGKLFKGEAGICIRLENFLYCSRARQRTGLGRLLSPSFSSGLTDCPLSVSLYCYNCFHITGTTSDLLQRKFQCYQFLQSF